MKGVPLDLVTATIFRAIMGSNQNIIPVHYADAIRCHVRRPPQGSLLLLTGMLPHRELCNSASSPP